MAGSVKYKVSFIKPSFPSAEEMTEDYRQIVASNWFTNFGPFERRFAQAASSYIGEGFQAATFSNATAALQAGILAILGLGDDTRYVIMPSFTFAAGADALIWCGYKPLFIDIEADGLQMDINQAQTALEQYGDKIAGILFCNAFGVGTENIQDWEDLARESGKPLIIDSAAGFGSLYSQAAKVGSAGDCEIFSLHATKSFAVGEGGLLVTRNQQLVERLESIQNFGFGKNRDATQLGFNGKLQEINAAIGLRQLTRLDDILAKRRHVFSRYQAELNSEQYGLQANAANASLCFAATVVKQPGQRNARLAALQEAGVDAKTYYNPPLHSHTYFKDCETLGALPITQRISESILSLPVYDSMSEDDIDLVVGALNAQ